MLGSAFASVASGTSRFDVRALSREELDVRDQHALMAHADWVAGGWVVHCAGTVDVRRCAQQPNEARETLVLGTLNAIHLAKSAQAKLFYPQSFLVYEGGDDIIAEDTPPNPLSLYGELKWEAERLLDALEAPLVVRMAGFFGGESRDKNFVGLIIPLLHRAIAEGKTVFEVGDRVWQPTWTQDIAFNSLHLMEAGSSGVYPMSSHGHAAFHEVADQIVSSLGWSDRLRIQPVSAAAVAAAEVGPERRPGRVVLSCERLRRENRDLQRDWRSALNAYLSTPYFDRYRLEH